MLAPITMIDVTSRLRSKCLRRGDFERNRLITEVVGSRGTRRILSSMSRHRIPRWMNVLWLVFVFGLTFSFMGVAIHRGYDFVQTVGFLVANFGSIFGLAVVVGLALYGLSILLEGWKAHKSHSGDDDHSGDMANLVP